MGVLRAKVGGVWVDITGPPGPAGPQGPPGALTVTAWTAPSFLNGWVNNGGTSQPVRYRKVGDMVYIEGTVKSGTVGQSAFILPAGFRPLADRLFATVSNNTFAVVTVTTAGVVTPAVGVSWVTLDLGFSTL